MIRPRSLPKLREQTLRHLTDPTPAQHVYDSEGSEPDEAGLDRLVHHLRAAGLWWVAPDMAALAVSAGGQLDAARWATTDRPAPCGLIHFADGIGTVPAGRGLHAPVEGLLWGPHPDGLQVLAYISRRALTAHLEQRQIPDRLAEHDAAPTPLLFIGGDILPVTAEPSPLAAVESDMRPILAALAAAWRLMQQPTLAARTTQRADKAARRNAARDGLADPDVTIVDLRRQYTPQDADPSEGIEDGRRYRHRWVVSGHWRHYRSQRYSEHLRREGPWWIPQYVKGPHGAPLLATERVNVWRR